MDLGFSIQPRTSGGGILLATWSAMLAARAEGVGSTFTRMRNQHADEVKALL